MDGGISKERAAHNQSLYRLVNEQLKPINEVVEELGESVSEWICECADRTCTLHVFATLTEYEVVRAKPRTFIVEPGHVLLDVESVVLSNDRYSIVEKLANGGEVAESLDPRRAG